jgi:hypothetical protein
MFERVQRGRGGKHPAGKNARGFFARPHFVDLQERRRLGRLFGRARVAKAHGDGERAKAHRHACRRFDVGGAARDLVERTQHSQPLDAMGVHHGVIERKLAQRRRPFFIGLRARRARGEHTY